MSQKITVSPTAQFSRSHVLQHQLSEFVHPTSPNHEIHNDLFLKDIKER